jgi:formamidase
VEQREVDFIATSPTACRRWPTRRSHRPPTWAAEGRGRDKAAAEGARTVPPREHGGNCDIKDLSRGSKIFFPVYVEGARPVGGRPALQPGRRRDHLLRRHRDGRLGAHEGQLIKGGMAKYGIKNPIFKPSPITPSYNDYLIFEGISVDEQGKQHYLDVHVAYRQACLNAIEYLKKFGYSGAQAYSILGTAPVQGHISGVVDIPNACATLWLPTRSSTSTSTLLTPTSAHKTHHARPATRMAATAA